MPVRERLQQIARWLAAHFPLREVFWLGASVLAWLGDFVNDRREMFAVRFVVDLWLRFPLVRLVTGLFSGLIAVMTILLLLVRNEVAASDLLQLPGHYAGYTRVAEYEERLALQLAEYSSPFLLHAHSVGLFDEDRFLAEVQPGDPLTIAVEKRREAELASGQMLVAFEVRSANQSYLELEPLMAANRAEARGFPGIALVAIAIAAASLALIAFKPLRPASAAG